MIYTMTLNPAVDRELAVEAIEFNEVLRATSSRVDCGGKGFNVSRMLAELGEKSIALGFAGGKSGELLQERLQAVGIETQFVWIEGETRTNVSIVTAAQGYVKVNEAGPLISTAAQEQLLNQVRKLVQANDWWVLAGSLPPNVPCTIYAQLTEIIETAGGRVILDTSGAALQAGCVARPFLAKPNDSEAQALTGLPVTTTAERITAAQAIRAQGVGHVIMSLGKDGALLVTDEGIWHATPPHITERNPIGAGDSLVGGVTWGLSRGLTLPEALRWGIACGAGTASTDGTAVGGRELVHELVNQVELEKVG